VGRPAAGVLYVVAMAAVVVGVDVLFFRGHFWERLAANLGNLQARRLSSARELALQRTPFA
jgi:hypothetical protein